jgi:hypothetical protein
MEKKGKTRNMNNTMPKPKKHHSSDGHTARNNLPATIARLEAYSNICRVKKEVDEKITKIRHYAAN